MDEQHTRVETNRMSGDGQAGNGSSGNGAQEIRRSYRSARLDDGRSTPPAATGVGFDPPTSTQPPPEQRTREVPGGDRPDPRGPVGNRERHPGSQEHRVQRGRQRAPGCRHTARDIAESDSVQCIRPTLTTAMVGIGIAGLAWLFLGRRDAGDYSRSYPRARRRPGLSAYDTSYDTYYPDEGASTGAASARMNRPPTYSGGDPYGRRGAAESDVVSRGSAMAADLGREARQTTRRVQSRLQQTWNESPLLIGAAAAVAGAMVGMAVPETERENEWLGQTRDNMIEDVQQTVRETVGKVQNAATAAVGLGADQEGGQQQQSTGSQERRGSMREDFAR